MTSEISAMLDELMGKNRNSNPDNKNCEGHWSDPDVCKYYLCGLCPAELFINTRSDLGPCEKHHDDNLKSMYEKSEKYMKTNYETDLLRYLQQCMTDVERRIRRNHQRLQLTEEKNAAKQQNAPGNKDNEEHINFLTKKIDTMLEQIETLGSEGNVEEAQGVMKLVEQLKEDREQLRQQKGNIMDAFSVQEKQMEVCEVCGAFLIVGDAQSRVDDHLMGKQHMGYAKIKATIEELKERINTFDANEREKRKEIEKKRLEEKTKPRSRSKDHHDRNRDRHRDGDRHRDSDRRRDGDRHKDDRHRRKSSRDRRPSRSRDRDSRRSYRSRSQDKRRSRSRDRRSSHKHTRPRSRSRDADRKRSRRSRSRDKSRKSRDEDSKRRRDEEDKKKDSKRSKSRERKLSKPKDEKEVKEEKPQNEQQLTEDKDCNGNDVPHAEIKSFDNGDAEQVRDTSQENEKTDEENASANPNADQGDPQSNE